MQATRSEVDHSVAIDRQLHTGYPYLRLAQIHLHEAGSELLPTALLAVASYLPRVVLSARG